MTLFLVLPTFHAPQSREFPVEELGYPSLFANNQVLNDVLLPFLV